MAELEHGAASLRPVGRMTAVMRAVRQPSGPQIVRVARVEGDGLVEERLFVERAPIRVGASEDATLFVDGLATSVMFEPLRRGYLLRLPPSGRARVVMGEQLVELDAIGTVERELLLDDGARGRIELEGATLLFQLVDPPPPRVRRDLPRAMKKGALGDIDWFTTITAALSFLMHFFAVGLVYSDWGDPVIADEHSMAQMLTALDRLPAPPPLETPRSEATNEPGVTATAAATSERETRGRGSGQASSSAARRGSEGSADARAADIASQLARLDVEVLVGLDQGRVATRDVLGSSEIPARMLEDAAASRAGVDEADGLVGLGGDGADALQPGAQERRLSDIGERRARAVATSAGSSQAPAGPVARASVSVSDPTREVPGAEGVVARMRGGFRHCYQRGLDDHPEMEGAVTLVATIGPNGEVLSTAGGGGGLAPILPCLKAVVSAGVFAPPRSGRAVLAIPVRFWRQ